MKAARETVHAPFRHKRKTFSDAISQPSPKVKTNQSVWGALSRLSFFVSDGILFPFLRAQNLSPARLPPRGTKVSSALLWIRNESSSMVNGVLNLRDDSTRIVGEHPPGLHINSWCAHAERTKARARRQQRQRHHKMFSSLSVPNLCANNSPSSQHSKPHRQTQLLHNDKDISRGWLLPSATPLFSVRE